MTGHVVETALVVKSCVTFGRLKNMSRIGKKPIDLSSAITVNLQGQSISVKGPKGNLNWMCPADIQVAHKENTLVVTRGDDTKQTRALHGLSRSLINNMVIGVVDGYRKELKIVGVGYRAEAKGAKLIMSLGFSHPVEFLVPEGITAQVDKKQTTITLDGIDKQLVGQVAADIRAFRPPDAYKGKGIRYADEVVSLKAGKAGKK